jgi:hypothetical protein
MLKQQKIIFVTVTYKRAGRIEFLQRHIDFLISKITNFRWIVVEDGDRTDDEVAALLDGYNATYLNIGPTKDKGNVQRNLALEYIRDHKLEGVVYNMDDDNLVYPALCDELRKVNRVSIFPVGNLGSVGIERPVIVGNSIIGWMAGWTERKYPVDMGGFALPSQFLFDKPSPIWQHEGIGGETEFIERFAASIQEIDFSLCHWNKMCLVFHNEPL